MNDAQSAATTPERIARRTVLRAQAGYYIATGLWPLVHRRSFEAVSGRKADFWLAQTVGVTITAIGCGIAVGLRRGRLSPEMRATAVLAAVGLGVLEVVYVARRRISRIYLLDAAGEAAFVATLTARDRSAETLA
jgi:hypothetical protein